MGPAHGPPRERQEQPRVRLQQQTAECRCPSFQVSFSGNFSESVAECEFDSAAVEILYGNSGQSGGYVRPQSLAVVAVIVPGHSVTEILVQVEDCPHVGLLVV